MGKFFRIVSKYLIGVEFTGNLQKKFKGLETLRIVRFPVISTFK